MTLVIPTSLSATLDGVNALLLGGKRVPKASSEEIVHWLAGRCGIRGSYAGMPAPTERDFGDGIRVFTGERVITHAGIAHLLGEEACRVLVLLAAETPDTPAIHAQASAGMLSLLGESSIESGVFCCGKCSVALWRHVAAGGLRACQPERLLRNGVKALNSERDGKSGWGYRFPFWYTTLALTEMGVSEARAELQHASLRLERTQRRSTTGLYTERHAVIAARALSLC